MVTVAATQCRLQESKERVTALRKRRNVEEQKTMNLVAAIEAFNETSQATIELLPTRNGSTMARLPRVGRDITVEGSPHLHHVKVDVEEVALLCEEARRAIAAGMALLEAGLGALSHLDSA